MTLPQPLLVNSRQKTKDIYIHRGQFMSYHIHKNILSAKVSGILDFMAMMV